jgi:chromate transporter
VTISWNALVALATQFASLSLLAFGGVNAVVPEMHRQAVDVHRWMSDADFSHLFALAQAAPGPNFMISTLIGWRVAGLAGAFVATIALCAPSCLLTIAVVRIWDVHRDSRWRAAIGSGLAPVTVGLVGASAWLLIKGADRAWPLAAVTTLTCLITVASRLNPLWCLAAAAAVGLSGVLG